MLCAPSFSHRPIALEVQRSALEVHFGRMPLDMIVALQADRISTARRNKYAGPIDKPRLVNTSPYGAQFTGSFEAGLGALGCNLILRTQRSPGKDR